MRTFDVYRHRTKGYQAVKQGLHHPAFIYSAVLTLLAMLFYRIAEEPGSGLMGILVVLLSSALFHLLRGFKGNDWQRFKLVRQGFEKVAAIEAVYPQGAIDTAADAETQDQNISEHSEKPGVT